MKGASRVVFAVLVAGAAACAKDEAEARPQWIVSIATDAPPPPFFDRLLVEVLDDSGNLACGAGCRRTFGFDDATSWPFEIAIVATDAPTHVRARVHRSDHVDIQGLPLPPMLLDVTGRLPPARGITRVSLDVPMDCFGKASDPQAHTTCSRAAPNGDEPTLGPVPDILPRLGDWAPGKPVDCRGAVPAGMVCIPGGVFFLGKVIPSGQLLRTAPEHLVQVSPFALDVDEMTVGEVRALLASGKLAAADRPVASVDDAFQVDHACTWHEAGNATDALPVTCIGHQSAAHVCEALGKRLPTEAELEWAAGNTTQETDYPWGGDPDVCANAIAARGRASLEASLAFEATSCRTKGPSGALQWGPVAGGSPRDVTKLGVRNLGGNVSEWAGDAFFASYDGVCWGPAEALLVDPRCDETDPRAVPGFVTRGGSWAFFEIGARAINRNGRAATAEHAEWAPDVGLRCATSL